MEYNTENVQHAVNIMLRAASRDSVSMETFQSPGPESHIDARIVRTEEAFHACGNVACFAGHVAISPEFQSSTHGYSTFYVDASGTPRMKDLMGQTSVFDSETVMALWLGVPKLVAGMLIYRAQVKLKGSSQYLRQAPHCLYGVKWEDVKAEHVLKVLRAIQEHGIMKMLEDCILQWADTEWEFQPWFIDEIAQLPLNNPPTPQ